MSFVVEYFLCAKNKGFGMKYDLSVMEPFMLLRKSQADKEEEKRARALGREYDALANQRDALLSLSARDGVTIPLGNIFAEVKSGERMEARGELQRLLGRLRALPRPGAVLYVVNTARVSRGLLTERGMLQDLFIEKQVLVRTMAGFTDLQVADERLLYEFQGALAHHYLLRYKEDVARTRAVQVEKGRVRNGSVPFGYVWGKDLKLPQPDPVEFPILKAICADAVSLSDCKLAQKYGVPQTTIATALKSPMICGWPAKTTAVDPETGHIRYLPREEWLFVEGRWPEERGEYETAMELEDWLRLQELREGRTKGRTGATQIDNAWCREVVRFVDAPGRVRLGCYCGYGGSYPTYERVAGKQRLFVPRAAVHAAVIVGLGDYLAREAARLALLCDRLARRSLPTAAGKELGELNAAREAVRQETERVIEELLGAGLGERVKEKLRVRLNDLEKREAVLARRIVELQAAIPMLSGGEARRVPGLIEQLTEDYPECWSKQGFSDEERALTVRVFVEAVEVKLRPKPGTRGYEREITVRRRDCWAL